MLSSRLLFFRLLYNSMVISCSMVTLEKNSVLLEILNLCMYLAKYMMEKEQELFLSYKLMLVME